MLRRVGKITAKRPGAVIVTVIILTAVLFSLYQYRGMESRMEEEDFTPNIKESKANSEIDEKFTSEYRLTIFARTSDKRSNIITPEGMATILELEDRLYSDSMVRENLRTSSQQDIISAADVLAQVIIASKLLEAMENYTWTLYQTSLAALNATFSRYASMGLVDNPSLLLDRIEFLLALRLAELEESTKENLTYLYNATLPGLKEDLLEALGGVLYQAFSSLNETLTSGDFQSMSEEEAKSFVNATFSSFLPSLLNNSSYTSYGVLMMDLADILTGLVQGTTMQYMGLLGEAMGVAVGEALQGRMENLTEELSALLGSLPGASEGMAGGGLEGPDGGLEGFSEMINQSLGGILTSISIPLGESISQALNESLSGAITAFTLSLTENLTLLLSPPLEVARLDVLNNITSPGNITLTLLSAEDTALSVLPQAVNNSLTVLTQGVLQASVDLEGAGEAVLENEWPEIYAILNTTYLQILDVSESGALESLQTAFSSGGEGSAGGDMSQYMTVLTQLSYSDKIKVFRGGVVRMRILSSDFNLTFHPLSQEELEGFIRNAYLNPSPEYMPLMITMNSTFTREFRPPEEIYAVGLMISLSFSDELNRDEELAGNIERRVDRLTEEVDATEEDIVFTTLGSSLIADEIMDSSMESMNRIFALAILAVIIILLLVYRSIYDLVMSLMALLMAILWTYGFGAILGYIFNPLLIAVPVLIVGLGIDFGIHLIMRYRSEREEGMDPDEATERTVGSVGMALLLATFTTVVAFLSNAISPIPTLSQFGVLSALGIISSFFIMVTFVPATRVLRDRKAQSKGVGARKRTLKKREEKPLGSTLLERGLTLGAVGSERHPVVVLSIALLLTGVGFYAYTEIPTKFDVKDFLPEEIPLARELRFMLEEYNFEDVTGGDVRILVKGDVATVDFLERLRDAQDNMADSRGVVTEGGEPQVDSILTLMEDYATVSPGGADYRYNFTFSRMYHRVIGPDLRPLPNATDEDISALYDWLYENARVDAAGLLHRDPSGRYDATVIRVQVSVRDEAKVIYRLRADLNDDVRPLKEAQGIDDVVVTSGPILTQIIMDTLDRSQINSIIITFTVSFIAMGVVYYLVERSFVLGAITTLPMIFCMAWLFASMYLLGIPLNVLTITIASLTVGLGITYGIHMSHRFAEDLHRLKKPEEAMRSTALHVGSAIFGAAATTMAGFGLLIFALLPPVQQFGGMTALAILYSFLSAVFVLPSILILWARKVCGREESLRKWLKRWGEE